MKLDRYDLVLTTDSDAAASAYREGIDCILSAWIGADEALKGISTAAIRAIGPITHRVTDQLSQKAAANWRASVLSRSSGVAPC